MTETKLRTGLILLIGALGMLQPFSLDPYLPNIPFIAHDLHAQATLIAQNLTFLTLGISAGTVVAGPMSDAIGRKLPVLIALAGYAGAALLTANASTVEIFFTGRTLQGFFAACAAVVANAMLRDMYQGLLLIKALARSILLMGSSWFIGPIFGSALQSFTNWRGLGYILATLAFALLALTFWKLPDTMSKADRTKTTAKDVAKRFFELLKDRVFLGLVMIQATISVALFSYLNLSPFIYQTPYGIGPSQIGFFLAINSGCSYLGAQFGAAITKRVRPQYVLLGSLILGAIAGAMMVATAIFQLPVWAFLISLALFILSFGISVTPIMGLAMDSHPEEAGTAAAIIAVAGTIATTVAGPYYAVLSHTSAIGMGLTQFGFLAVGIILLFAVVRPNKMEVMK
jgi:DHA1 family bicyclomycin/chloramphenicol resistance-like MFS transporter